MATDRFLGVDQEARRALHVACADPDCRCFACQLARAAATLRAGGTLMERPRCPGRRRDG